ncbi:mucin-5AC-like [Ctenopharyngodon idella]|uniref:mucin-5AC-like n=1 Tax=Ctenopharyngodon idella TaxID=7959 RepID=UPI002230581E|nr:mucin-5AC-like [Ctenopharyngodon idella]
MKCGVTETETCLKAITLALSDGSTVFKVDSNGNIEVNRIIVQLPLLTADVSIFKPSSFYIIIQAHLIGLRLEIQLVPLMQLYITVNSAYQGETCGLCGNFNNIEADDFTTIGGLREGTALDFANTWKTRASCPDVKRTFENPCSLSTENEKYAQHWCSLLSDSSSVFAPCHSEINPEVYKANCIYDSCNCEKSEDCMCAALSSYVHACAARGIVLDGWRDAACKKYTLTCVATTVYSYQMTSCDRTCRSLSQSDSTCAIDFVPVDGCGCAEGTYMNENGDCVASSSCSCYDSGKIIPAGISISKDGGSCICEQGKLSCSGGSMLECNEPMTFFNCSSASPGSKGSECQKSCNTLDMACISTECVSGCVCPTGLVSDGKGGCIAEDLCPCIHNGIAYQPGESIKTDCNTCTCKNRRWICTTNQCSGTCSIYGDGHYRTFDEKRYVFSGNCEYSLVQDFCNSTTGTFRVITENIPCGSTGTTCSKAIKLFLGSNELRLTDGSYQVVRRDAGEEIPYQMRTMGLYLVIEASNGLMLIWDRKTTIHIKLNPEFNGRVCGLCGNYDGNANNDFTTRSQAIAVDALDFVNSWKLSSCPDATLIQEPCVHNPYREAWAQRQCSIITSNVFSTCHSQVDPSPFYDACVRDACACDSGGDYECFCTAVTAYAQACNEAGACVAWRTPKICPLFCDYYNPPGECEWHYKPCGAPCMQTCRNPSGNCSSQIPALEGCYPKCPPEQPVFDEDNMKCVTQEDCGCYVDMLQYQIGQQVPTTENCQSCYCTSFGVICEFDVNACTCQYNNVEYNYGDIIYHTTDGLGGCITGRCSVNGTIERTLIPCETTAVPTVTSPLTTTQKLTPTPTTVFVFSTPVVTSTQPTTQTKTTEVPVTTLVSTTVSAESSTAYELTTQGLSSTTKPVKAGTTLSTTSPAIPSTTVLVEEGSTTVQPPTETSAPTPMEVCVHNTTVYQPGSPIPSDDPCTLCHCGGDVDPETKLLTPECVIADCNYNCTEDQEYQSIPGQCCGECVSTNCVVMHDNVTVTISVNQTWQPTNDKCVKYECERNNGNSLAVEIKTACPAFNAEDCIPGTETTDANGCCKTCTLDNKCNVQKNSTFLVSNDCISSTPVEITSCAGLCGTSSIYSVEVNALVHSCSCCQEMTTTIKEVTLTCPDGSNINHSYIHIESCGCRASDCSGQSTYLKRRRRRL